MIEFVTAVILISMVLIIVRVIKGPTTYDRILASNIFGTKTVALIVLMSFLIDDTMFLDVALIYALINFVSVIGFLKYFKYGSFGKE